MCVAEIVPFCLSICNNCHAEGNDNRDLLFDAVLGRAVSDYCCVTPVVISNKLCNIRSVSAINKHVDQ
jgi:hypothetical protein